MRYSLALACAMMATPIAAQDVRVIADVQVTHSLVSMVMGDLGAPGLLLDQGGDPHSFQLRPSQARDLAGADLIFWMGEDLTPWLARAISGTEARGDVVSLLAADGVHLQEFASANGDEHGDEHGDDDTHDAHSDHAEDSHDAHDHDTADSHDDHGSSHDDAHDDHSDHGHDDHSDDAHDDHDHGAHAHDHAHGGADPHAWIYPANAVRWLDVIAAELSEHDPANAATYAANAEAAAATIAALNAEITDILAPVGNSPIMTFHDAYGYLNHGFGVNIAGTIALGDAAAPGAQRLSELRAQLQDGGAVCIFPEVNHSSRYVDVVVEGTGVRVGAELDPAGVMLEPGAALYPTLMRNLAQAIADCVTG